MLAVLLGCTHACVVAQTYPLRPLKIISPFAPGGGTDFVARLIAPKLASLLGQQVIVENRPGAGGMMGVEFGVRSPPDGYTFVLISGGYCVNPSFYKLKFHPVEDITAVIQIAHGPLLLTAHPSLPVRTVKELIALAKSRPEQINFSTSGHGSIGHMAGELFSYTARVKLMHIPYKGTGPALIDTIAGQTMLNFGGITNSLPYVKSGQIKALGVTTAKKVPDEPQIPTMAEAGLADYEVSQWQGLMAPKGVPSPIVELMNKHVMTIIGERDVGDRFRLAGMAPAGGSPEQFLARIRGEIALWRKIAGSAGIRVD